MDRDQDRLIYSKVQLGQKKFVSNIIPFDSGREVQERFNDKTINELVKACFDMGEVKTGALIVIEEEIRLDEYVRTGINIDGILTSQLLINIFEPRSSSNLLSASFR